MDPKNYSRIREVFRRRGQVNILIPLFRRDKDVPKATAAWLRFQGPSVLAALKEEQTIQQLAKRFAIHTSQIQEWKRRLLEGARDVFASAQEKTAARDEPSLAPYEEIGRLKVQLEWLKKKSCPVRRSASGV